MLGFRIVGHGLENGVVAEVAVLYLALRHGCQGDDEHNGSEEHSFHGRNFLVK